MDYVDVDELGPPPDIIARDEDQPAVLAVQKAQIDWPTFNKSQKSKAIAWFETRPCDKLVFIVTCLSLGIAFLRVVNTWFLTVGSSRLGHNALTRACIHAEFWLCTRGL